MSLVWVRNTNIASIRPPVTRSNEPQRISRKGKIGEVKDGELWNMLVGREINFRSLRQNLATKLRLDNVVRLEG